MNRTQGNKPIVRLEDALDYLDIGISVIPIKPGTKQAQVAWKSFQASPPTESDLRHWFGEDDQRALAAIMGPASGGLVARDFDANESYERWRDRHDDVARMLPTVVTARGRHVYARADEQQVHQVCGKGRRIVKLGDGELRAGGYCLVPPSRHPNGDLYRWQTPLAQMPPYVDLADAGLLRRYTENSGENSKHRTCESSALSVFQSVGEAIAAALPKQRGQRHRCLFKLARNLKAIPELADAPLSSLKRYVRRWHETAVMVIGTKPFEESWLDFAEAWGKVKFPTGSEPVRLIYSTAIDGPLPSISDEYEASALRNLIALCRELQRLRGDSPFYLDCRTAGELLGVDHMQAWRWLRLLQHDGVLALVSTGSRETRRANSYRYLPSLDG